MEKHPAATNTAEQWREVLLRSKAQIAAGETVPLMPVLDRLQEAAERLERELGVTEDGERVVVRR